MIIHCVTVRHYPMQSEHHWLAEHCDQSLFFPLALTHSRDSVRVKELERLNRDFSLGSDCPNSTSTRTVFVGGQQRNYSHLQTQSSHIHLERRAHTHTHEMQKDLPLFPLLAQTEELLQTPTHVHTETWRRREREKTERVEKQLRSYESEKERMCQIDIGHGYHQSWIKIHYSEPPDNLHLSLPARAVMSSCLIKWPSVKGATDTD